MTIDSPTEKLVSHLDPKHRAHRRIAKWLGRIVLVVGLLGFGLEAAMASTPRQKGIFLVLLVASLIGVAIAWLSGASNRLSASGRALGNYRRTRSPWRRQSPLVSLLPGSGLHPMTCGRAATLATRPQVGRGDRNYT